MGRLEDLALCGILRGIPRKVPQARHEAGIETSLSQLGTEGWGPEPQMGSFFWCLVPEDSSAVAMRKWNRLGHKTVKTQQKGRCPAGESNSQGQRLSWPGKGKRCGREDSCEQPCPCTGHTIACVPVSRGTLIRRACPMLQGGCHAYTPASGKGRGRKLLKGTSSLVGRLETMGTGMCPMHTITHAPGHLFGQLSVLFVETILHVAQVGLHHLNSRSPVSAF